MDCPKCRHVSLPGSNFCEKCGYDLKAYTRQKPRSVEPNYAGSYSSPNSNSYQPPSHRVAPAPAPAPVPGPSPTATPVQNEAYRPAPVQPVAPRPAAPVQQPQRTVRPAAQVPQAPAPTPIATPKPYALLEDPSGTTRFPLIYDRTEIGRRSVEDQILPEVDLTAIDRDGSTSRQHAVITKEENFVVLEDRGSRNGTFVDGKRLEVGQQVSLTVGMEIRFGTVRLHYRIVP